MAPTPCRILFVCLGNICRSPMAEGVFLHLVQSRGLQGRYLADSAGTGNWHCGNPPDSRATETAAKRGVHLPSICRQVRPDDFKEFDLIVPMDRSNRDDLKALCPAHLRHKIRLMRDFDPMTRPETEPEVPDPYYGDERGFDRVFELLHRSCDALLDHLESEIAGAGA